jgi:hypothetical protein
MVSFHRGGLFVRDGINSGEPSLVADGINSRRLAIAHQRANGHAWVANYAVPECVRRAARTAGTSQCAPELTPCYGRQVHRVTRAAQKGKRYFHGPQWLVRHAKSAFDCT